MLAWNWKEEWPPIIDDDADMLTTVRCVNGQLCLSFVSCCCLGCESCADKTREAASVGKQDLKHSCAGSRG